MILWWLMLTCRWLSDVDCDSRPRCAVGYELDSGAGLGTVELNTTRAKGTGPTKTLPIGTVGREVEYLDRAGWAADESLRFKPNGSLAFGPTQFFPTQTLTVHHTAGINDDPDPASTARAIYYLDAITNGWGDMGYHLLIDEAGRVYEGRYSGDDGVPVFGPGNDANGRPQVVTGAHIQGWNSGNVGVVLLGDFTSVQPKPAALDTLENVLAALADQNRGDEPASRPGRANATSLATATCSGGS
jgi:N-acetylmuramoyl-L-alanine amidase